MRKRIAGNNGNWVLHPSTVCAFSQPGFAQINFQHDTGQLETFIGCICLSHGSHVWLREYRWDLVSVGSFKQTAGVWSRVVGESIGVCAQDYTVKVYCKYSQYTLTTVPHQLKLSFFKITWSSTSVWPPLFHQVLAWWSRGCKGKGRVVQFGGETETLQLRWDRMPSGL